MIKKVKEGKTRHLATRKPLDKRLLGLSLHLLDLIFTLRCGRFVWRFFMEYERYRSSSFSVLRPFSGFVMLFQSAFNIRSDTSIQTAILTLNDVNIPHRKLTRTGRETRKICCYNTEVFKLDQQPEYFPLLVIIIPLP